MRAAPLRILQEFLRRAIRIAPLHRSSAWLNNLADLEPEEVTRFGNKPWAYLEDITKPVRY